MAKRFLKKDKGIEDYSAVKRKIFWQTLLLILASMALIWILLFQVSKWKISELIVRIIWFFSSLDYEEALSFYHYYIRANREFIILAMAGITFFLLFRLFLNWFTKYFSEINRGLDALISRDDKKIELSKEMISMENKLNSVRETLEQQFEDIQETERKKDELVMYLAHDIRTPLTSVIGYIKLMEEMPNLTDEQRAKFLQVALEKAERLEVLVNEFFDITRYGKQALQVTEGRIDLYYMLAQMVEEVFPAIEEQGKHIKLDVSEDCGIYGDADKLARVFQNILKNAIAYSKAGSSITVRARENDTTTVIWFSNHGREIEKERLAHLFDKFYRMDEARQTNSGGAGLGLAIAKELVEMHGGTIGADCEGDKITFTVMLPKREN